MTKTLQASSACDGIEEKRSVTAYEMAKSGTYRADYPDLHQLSRHLRHATSDDLNINGLLDADMRWRGAVHLKHHTSGKLT
ncbi:unnamed protein product [Anisakis simplex]|uniref:Uncharacterized protein n=1 Tax=Anisakis simplex TaxID=6269 RepID=A0A0M3K2R6_ANISI|nr:unnamed protein product [Anisakis simplex]